MKEIRKVEAVIKYRDEEECTKEIRIPLYQVEDEYYIQRESAIKQAFETTFVQTALKESLRCSSSLADIIKYKLRLPIFIKDCDNEQLKMLYRILTTGTLEMVNKGIEIIADSSS